MRKLLLTMVLYLAGCANSETGSVPIEGSTYRMSSVTQMEDSELDVEIFRTRQECRAAVGPPPAEDLCVPQVDRQNGEVRMSFRLRRPRTGDLHALSLTKDVVQVSHMGSVVGVGAKQAVELTPMEEQRAGQLFIVLIDGSGSMYENDAAALTKVYNALRDREVIDAFYPGKVDTGVVLLRFTKTVKGLDGLPPVVLNTRSEYKAMLEYISSGERGFTHLYDAVSYSVTDLMEEQSIKDWKTIHSAEPTIIALTDGFNNEAGSDSCATNAPRLQKVLETVSLARQEASFQDRPTVYTVGLGKAIRPRFEVPDDKQVRPNVLCGKYQNSVINGGLERQGIDNVSLSWMAKVGGGESFVRNDDNGLAEVFKAAAAVRYGWYQVRYRVDGFHHRRSFESRIKLLAFARAGATVTFEPSAWIDGPSTSAGGAWRKPLPFWATLGPVMTLLGILVLIHFSGPAGFNARRAVFRRAQPTGAQGGGAAEPQAQAGVDPNQPPPQAPPPQG
ncbi:MAG: VWA domain-containing protein [Deltaproteobacteria bacterium]|nr:MAG: VWA domain-containing protein [Deltaproteobacteria bacterium]